jgi:hypothetical protein
MAARGVILLPELHHIGIGAAMEKQWQVASG